MATKPTPTKSDFCRSFEWKRTTKIKWLDSSGMIELPGDRLARIELSGPSGHYSQFIVSIISKTAGLIDSKTFMFFDYLDITKRKDARADWKPNGFYVVGHCGMVWYIAEPTTTKPLTIAIEHYVDMYR